MHHEFMIYEKNVLKINFSKLIISKFVSDAF